MNPNVGTAANNWMEDSERICGLICKHAADLISVVSVSGQRVYLNPSYQKIFGITSSDSSAFPEIHPDDRPLVKKVIDDTLATGVSQRAEVRLFLNEGYVLYVDFLTNAITDEFGKPNQV